MGSLSVTFTGDEIQKIVGREACLRLGLDPSRPGGVDVTVQATVDRVTGEIIRMVVTPRDAPRLCDCGHVQGAHGKKEP